jgi:hypothetical protein
LEKNYSWKKFKFFLDQKLQFTYPQASIKNVQVTEEAFSSQKRPSSTSKHELLKNFLLLWVIFALLDPDPDPDSESGSTVPIEFGSNPDPDTDPDPDPQPWFLFVMSIWNLFSSQCAFCL